MLQVRRVAVLLGSTAAAGAIVAWLLPVALAGGRDLGGLDGALTVGCATTGSLAAVWSWVVVVLTVVGSVAGDGRPRTGALCGPVILRRAVLAACGVTAVASLTVPAAHAGGRGGPGPTVGSVVARILGAADGPRAAGPGAAAAPDQDRDLPARVTVHPGDCLWGIAADDLAATRALGRPEGRRDIDDAEIDRRWREIYAANRDLIGADPDLIQPAQRLRLPH